MWFLGFSMRTSCSAEGWIVHLEAQKLWCWSILKLMTVGALLLRHSTPSILQLRAGYPCAWRLWPREVVLEAGQCFFFVYLKRNGLGRDSLVFFLPFLRISIFSRGPFWWDVSQRFLLTLLWTMPKAERWSQGESLDYWQKLEKLQCLCHIEESKYCNSSLFLFSLHASSCEKH